MKALVKQQAAPGIWLEDVPEPRVGPNDVLIEIAKTAICGTDMHIYNWDPWAQKTIPVPMAVGHEYCGRIVEIGSEVNGLKSGDRVSGEGPVGIMATAVARFTGARHVVITDVNDYRLELARRMGATRAINVRRDSLDLTMQDLGMQEGFDVGLEMSGNATALREMLRTMHHGGSVAILGIPPAAPAIDWN